MARVRGKNEESPITGNAAVPPLVSGLSPEDRAGQRYADVLAADRNKSGDVWGAN